MEQRILEAEQEAARWERCMHEAGADAPRLQEAYDQHQAAHKRVEELYARWAELESKIGV